MNEHKVGVSCWTISDSRGVRKYGVIENTGEIGLIVSNRSGVIDIFNTNLRFW